MTKREFYEEFENCSIADIIRLTYDYGIEDRVKIMDEEDFESYLLDDIIFECDGWRGIRDFLNDVYDKTCRYCQFEEFYLFVDGELNSVVTEEFDMDRVISYVAEALEETQEDWYDESSDSYDELFDVDEELIEGFDAECEEEDFCLDDDLFLPGETISDAETVGDNGITLWL